MAFCVHVITETAFGQTLALQLGDGDEHHALESDTTGLNVKGNLFLMILLMFFKVNLILGIHKSWSLPQSASHPLFCRKNIPSPIHYF